MALIMIMKKSLNEKTKPMLFCCYKSEYKQLYSFLNYETNKEKRMYLFLNYWNNRKKRMYSFLNYWWFDIATREPPSGMGQLSMAVPYHWPYGNLIFSSNWNSCLHTRNLSKDQEAEFLDVNRDKSLKSFPPCYSQSSLPPIKRGLKLACYVNIV
jgi:hypothetical protein